MQLWTSVAEAVSDAIVALPAEPIGPGAKWTVIERLRRGGVVMLRKTAFELVDIEKGELLVLGEVVEVAVADGARDPAMAKEVSLEVLDGVAAGKRRHKVLAGQLWPIASETELATDLTPAGNGYVRALQRREDFEGEDHPDLAYRSQRSHPMKLRDAYARFLEKNDGRILLSGHSHQAWPDVARAAQLAVFDDAAELVDDKWGPIFELQAAVGTEDP